MAPIFFRLYFTSTRFNTTTGTCVSIACVQREEEERKEEERRRTTEQRRLLEKERILKERRDAEERDRKMDEKLKMIEEQRSDCPWPYLLNDSEK